MITKKLILLDIDGTLLDAKYRCNDPSLKDVIANLQSMGVSFCLNSNRALEDLLPVAEDFGIKGPIVGENGIFVYDSSKNTTKYLISRKHLEELARCKNEAESAMLRILEQQFPNSKVYWRDINTVESAKKGAGSLCENGAIVVHNNKFRRYTISAHLKKCQDGKPLPQSDGLEEITELLTQELSERNVTVTSSSVFSNILLYSSLTSKRTAVEYLLKQSSKETQLIVIGDEVSDYLMASGIGAFWTTANAPNEVRRKAHKVASSTYAQGVNELLNLIGD